MIKYILALLLFITPFFFKAQGYGYVLFSGSGDTVISRTSFGHLGKKDTITTYFVVNTKVENGIKNISIFTIDEKETPEHSIGYACADYKTISIDTITKYNIKHLGALRNEYIEKIRIQSKVIQKSFVIVKGKKIKQKQIQHTFSMDGKIFLTETVWVLKDKEKITKPKISKVYHNQQIGKYFVEYFISDNYFNKETNTIVNRHTRKEIII